MKLSDPGWVNALILLMVGVGVLVQFLRTRNESWKDIATMRNERLSLLQEQVSLLQGQVASLTSRLAGLEHDREFLVTRNLELEHKLKESEFRRMELERWLHESAPDKT